MRMLRRSTASVRSRSARWCSSGCGSSRSSTSFFSLSLLRFDSVWTSGLVWILTIAVPTVAVFLIVLRRLSPTGIRRVGSLGHRPVRVRRVLGLGRRVALVHLGDRRLRRRRWAHGPLVGHVGRVRPDAGRRRPHGLRSAHPRAAGRLPPPARDPGSSQRTAAPPGRRSARTRAPALCRTQPMPSQVPMPRTLLRSSSRRRATTPGTRRPPTPRHTAPSRPRTAGHPRPPCTRRRQSAARTGAPAGVLGSRAGRARRGR